jgi:hypothetical protein
MTMSLLPRSRWQTLLNLETIKVSCPMHAQYPKLTRSNAISQRNRQRRQKPHRSSSLLSAALKPDSTCRPRNLKPKIARSDSHRSKCWRATSRAA